VTLACQSQDFAKVAKGRVSVTGMDGKFDEMLLGLAQKHRGIEDLLYTIMSFYERRTDMFHIKENDDEKKGFKPGKAEEMLHKQFNTFQARYLERAQPHLIIRRNPRAATPSSSTTTPALPTTSDISTVAGASSASEGNPSSQSSGSADVPQPKRNPQGIPDGVQASPLDGGDPGQWAREQEEKQGFRWSQSVQEVVVEIDVEKSKVQEIKVDFSARKVCVKRKGEVLMEGKLHDKVSCEESTWHLDDGKQIVLSLEKLRPAFWPTLFEGDLSTRQ